MGALPFNEYNIFYDECLQKIAAQVMSTHGTAHRSATGPGACVSFDENASETIAKVVPAWHGFAAGSASGLAKCLVGHPFDTVKVRLQTSKVSRFRGPIDCVMQTIRHEGVAGLYKGVTPPMVGWLAMDSVMLGSLTAYRRLLNDYIFNPRSSKIAPITNTTRQSKLSSQDMSEGSRLPAFGHGLAGMLAGWTVSFVAAPVEHIKARLQIQYQSNRSHRHYSGPIDCAVKLFQNHGFRGIWHGLGATMLFRTSFFFWWSSYDIFTQSLTRHTALSTPSINFWAGGLSAQVFWLFTYPTDVVKQRVMTDSLGSDRQFFSWRDAARTVYTEGGYKAFYRGFVPTMLRSFPANATALLAFESVMRGLS